LRRQPASASTVGLARTLGRTMGRQIAVAMLPGDETEFLAFLHASGPVRIFRSSAPSLSQHEVLGPNLEDGNQFFIWPTAFDWEPEFKQVRQDAPVLQRRGWFYLSNSSTGPVLEYDRHRFEAPPEHGRLYWAKLFAAPSGRNYDLPAFEAWYESVLRWVRKRGRRLRSERNGPYYLPHALARRSAA